MAELNEKTKLPLGLVWMFMGALLGLAGWYYGLKGDLREHMSVQVAEKAADATHEAAQDKQLDQMQEQYNAQMQAFTKASEAQVEQLRQNTALLQAIFNQRSATAAR